jgi:hypothetical protein
LTGHLTWVIFAAGRQAKSLCSFPLKCFDFLQDAPKANGGKIFVTSEELACTKEKAMIHFRAEKLDKKDLFGKSDPFFIVSKSMPSGQVCSISQFVVKLIQLLQD